MRVFFFFFLPFDILKSNILKKCVTFQNYIRCNLNSSHIYIYKYIYIYIILNYHLYFYNKRGEFKFKLFLGKEPNIAIKLYDFRH